MQSVIYIFVLLQITHACQIQISGLTNNESKICEGLEKIIQNFEASVTKRLDLINNMIQNMEQVKECGITDNKTETNAAFGKLTEQSSTFGPNNGPFARNKAVDRDPDTFACTSQEINPYWWVDLGKIYIINRIEIINRKDCCGERLHDLDITVGPSLDKMTLCAHYQGPSYNGEHLVFTCQKEARGRYVKIMIKGTEYLQLADVKVFVPSC